MLLVSSWPVELSCRSSFSDLSLVRLSWSETSRLLRSSWGWGCSCWYPIPRHTLLDVR